MARVSTYLNFLGQTEEAFNFYKAAFGTEFQGPIMRMGDIAPQEGMPPLADADKMLVMHIELPITGGHVLMATDFVESMGHELRLGNNTTITLEPDTREETERLHAALSAGGTDVTPLTDMFWGSYYGTCCDRYGIRWMFSGPGPQA